MEIEYEALEGELYYPEFKFDRNVCAPHEDVLNVNHWTVWMGADPHGRTPDAFLWEAYSDIGESRTIGELWMPGQRFTRFELADTIKWIESDATDKPNAFDWAQGIPIVVRRRHMDTHGKAFDDKVAGKDAFDTYQDYGLQFDVASKSSADLENARDQIAKEFLPKALGGMGEGYDMPMRQVFSTCGEIINQYQKVRYPEGEIERPADERPMTYRKHLLDCSHYIRTANPGYLLPRRKGGGGFTPIYPNLGR